MITFTQNVSESDRRVLETFNYRCIIDFRRYDTIHHIIPKSMGGTDDDENKVPLCNHDHRRIHDSGATNWIEYLQDLREKRINDLR